MRGEKAKGWWERDGPDRRGQMFHESWPYQTKRDRGVRQAAQREETGA